MAAVIHDLVVEKHFVVKPEHKNTSLVEKQNMSFAV